MPELLVYTQKITRISPGKDEVWERLYFLEEKIPDKVHNTFVKFSTEITIHDNPELIEKISKKISEKFIEDGQYESTFEYKFHAKKPFKNSLKNQHTIIQNDYKFIPYEIGLAMNEYINNKGEYGNLEIKYKENKDNQFIEYTDPRDNKRCGVYKHTVCLNIHFKTDRKKWKFHNKASKDTYINQLIRNLMHCINLFTNNKAKLVTYYEGINERDLLKNGFLLRDKGGNEGVLTRKAYTKYLLAKAKKLKNDIDTLIAVDRDFMTPAQAIELNNINNFYSLVCKIPIWQLINTMT